MTSRNKYNFVDLFAGIGGFHLGIIRATRKAGVAAECLLAVDIDPKARLTYSKNFAQTNFLNDVTDRSVKDSVPKDVDIICAGFPCQPFSVVGKKKGMDDHRGTLFNHIVEIVHTKKPKVIFMENVRNLLNIPNGDNNKLIEFIKEQMKQVGYPLALHTYKASDFGLPTRRDRLYMVGFREDIMPHSPEDSWWPVVKNVEPTTLAKYFKRLGKNWDKSNIKRGGWPNRVGRTIRLGGIGSSYKSTDWLNKHNLKPSEYIRVNENKIWVDDRRTWDSYLFFENNPNRKKPHDLTVDEAKAMMGFPSDFDFPEELSNNQRMEQLGNSVAIPVIEAVAEQIIKTLSKFQNG
jgi:DNA (cytosine-5)-methyltransferase 1